MELLNLNLCEEPGFLYVLLIIKYLITILKILVPIILMYRAIVPFVKCIISGKELTKELNGIIKSIIAALLIFFIPTIVNYAMDTLVDSDVDSSFAFCVSNANLSTIEELKAKQEEEIEQTLKEREENINNFTKEQNEKYQEELKENLEKEANNAESVEGEIVDFKVVYNKKDSEGRCGRASCDKCAAIATVTYKSGKQLTYYIGYQNNYGMINGPCVTHAMTSVINTLGGNTYSSLDVQNYQYNGGGGGKLKLHNLGTVMEHYNIKGTIYAGEYDDATTANLLRNALKNGHPVLKMAANSECSDMAGTAHAHLALYLDENDKVWLIDSANMNSKNGKRTPEQLVQCMLDKNTRIKATNWGQMIIFD